MKDEVEPTEKWLSMVAYSGSASPQTERAYRRNLTLFCQFARKEPEQILRDYENSQDREFSRKYADLVKAWIGFLQRRGYSRLSIISMIGTIQSFFKHLDLPLGYIPQGKKIVTYHNRDITREEVAEVLRISDPRDRAFFCVMAQSGLRPQTLCNLQIKHVQPDLRNRAIPCKITVPQDLAKGKYRGYFSFMSEESVRHLEDYLKTRPNVTPESFLFTQYGKEEPLDPKSISHAFRRRLMDLKGKGIIQFEQKAERKPSDLRLYNLRKFFRKMAHQAGFEYVQFWMGHTVTEGQEEHYRPTDMEHHRKIYREKAMPFLRFEKTTPSETEKIIEQQDREIKKLKEQVQNLNRSMENLIEIVGERKVETMLMEEFSETLKRLLEEKRELGKGFDDKQIIQEALATAYKKVEEMQKGLDDFRKKKEEQNETRARRSAS